MVSLALLPVNWLMLVPSPDTPTPKIAVNTTFAWKVLPANMVAPLALFSKLVTVTVLATVKIPKMFPAGKCRLLLFNKISLVLVALKLFLHSKRITSHCNTFEFICDQLLVSFSFFFPTICLIFWFVCYKI